MNGGGIYNEGGISVTGGSLTSNSAPYGAGIYNGGLLSFSAGILSDNSASQFGGGIENTGTATLTLSNDSISGNTSSMGGAVFNEAAMTLSSDTLSGNSAYAEGGAVYNDTNLKVSLASDSIATNSAGAGGGVYNDSNGTMTLTDDSFTANSVLTYGGGVYNNGLLTFNADTLSDNTAASNGGAFFNAVNATAVLTNATLCADSASGNGGGILNNGTLTLIDDTVSGNSARTGAGLYTDSGSTAADNSIIADNTATDSAPDVDGAVISEGDNLIGQTDGSSGWIGGGYENDDLVGTSADPLNPLLSALGNYGGPTETLALLPGSPAIDAVSTYISGAPTTDQRGMSRPEGSASDIGAFESQGFTIAATTGAGQTALVGAAFSSPLVATVAAINSVEPVAGGIVTFSAPANGASAGLSMNNSATIGSNGQVSVAATANATTGQYTVNASTTGAASPASFIMNNATTLVVNTLSDDPSGPTVGYTTLRDAITQIDAAPTTNSYTINFSVIGTIDLTSALPDLSNTVAVDGPGALNLTVQRDSNAADFSVFTVDSNANVSLSGMTIAGGNPGSGGGNIYGYGGGLNNFGMATVSADKFSDNSAWEGGGISNETGGTLTVLNSTFANNSAATGAGIYNYLGTVTLNSSSFTSNSVSGAGAGVANYGIMIGNGSAFSGNTASDDFGGGMANFGTLTLNGCSFTTNAATSNGCGGGIFNVGSLTVVAGIFSDNSAGDIGGAIYNDGTAILSTSTFSGNTAADSGGNVDNGNTSTQSYGGGAITNGDQLTVNSSTFTDNSAADGGAIFNSYEATATDDTFAGNSASTGGGLYNIDTMTLTNCTVRGNASQSGGGGIAIETSAGELTINNSIVAGNTSTEPGDNDISGQLQPTSAFNLIGNGSGITDLSDLEEPALSDLIGTLATPLNPLLAPLANYGGPTETMALLPGSPAIDAGSNALAADANGDALTTDQRGVGFSRVVNGTVDIGAFESEGFTLSPATDSTPQTASANATFANPLTVTVTANNPIEPVAGGTVTFVAPTSGATASLSPVGPVTIGANGQASVMATANEVGGQYTVTATTAGASASSSFILNNEFTPLSQTISISTVASLTYGAAPITLSATATSGLPVGFEVLSGPATLSGSVLTITGSGTVDVLASQTGNSTYTAATPVAESFTVAPAQLTVTPAMGLSMVYGGAVPTLTFTYTGLVNGDSSATITGSPATTATSSSNVGGYPITQGTLTATGNYVIGTFTSGALTINPAPLTVTAQPASRIYGAPNPTFTASISGFVVGQTLSTSGVAGSASFSTNDAPNSPVGSYRITPSIGTLTAANYTFTVFNTGTLSVTPAALTITASPQTKTYGTTLTLGTSSFTATGLQNGETVESVTLTSDGGQAATANAGTYTITPSAATGGTFNASNYSIAYSTASLVVTPAILVISAKSLTSTAGQPIPALTASYSGFLNGDSPASLSSLPIISTSATSSSQPGIYAITISNASSPNYTITQVPGILTLVASIPTHPAVSFVPTIVVSASIQSIKLTSRKTVKAIVLNWNAALNAADAANVANFRLSTNPSNKKQHPKAIAIAESRYQSGSTSLALVTRKKLTLSSPVKLTISSTGLLDESGNPVGAVASSEPGPNIVILLSKSGVVVTH